MRRVALRCVLLCAVTLYFGCADETTPGVGTDTGDISGGDNGVDGNSDTGEPDVVEDTVADAESETVADAEPETVADVVADADAAVETIEDAAPETVADTQDDGTTSADVEPETVEDVAEEVTPDVVESDTGEPCEPVVTGAGSHIVQAVMIENAGNYDCDSNNDGSIDSDDGTLNQSLTSGLIALAFDVNDELTTSVEQGDIILLLEMLGYDGSVSDATGVTTNLLIGADIEDQPDPTCGVGGNLTNSCDWYADVSSYYEDTCEPIVGVDNCSVTSDYLECGPSDFTFSLPLGGTVLDLAINDGRIHGGVGSGVELTDGRLCGWMPKSTITDAIDAACSEPNAPSFCDFAGLAGSAINCDPCTIVLAIEGAGVTSLSLPPQP